MILSTLQTRLENLGFEVVVSDNVLQAAREDGERAIEITIDSGGGVLVVKKDKDSGKNKEFKFKGRVVPIVCEILETQTFRAQLESPSDFREIEKFLKEA